MRRVMVLLAGVFLLPAAMGCCFTAGQCDCDPGCDRCTMYGIGAAPVLTAPLLAIEQSKAMPRVAK